MARLHRFLATLALLVAAIALSASPALARKRDHDKLPDRWERKFHLDTKKNDAKRDRDRDRDGLSNYREYRSHTNPRKKDTDRDGLKDGAERRFGFKPRDRDFSDADFDKQFDAAFAGGQTCRAGALRRGPLVHEATVDRSGASPVVTAVTLVRR